jgi:hypothetical protein
LIRNRHFLIRKRHFGIGGDLYVVVSGSFSLPTSCQEILQ